MNNVTVEERLGFQIVLPTLYPVGQDGEFTIEIQDGSTHGANHFTLASCEPSVIVTQPTWLLLTMEGQGGEARIIDRAGLGGRSLYQLTGPSGVGEVTSLAYRMTIADTQATTGDAPTRATNAWEQPLETTVFPGADEDILIQIGGILVTGATLPTDPVELQIYAENDTVEGEALPGSMSEFEKVD